VAYTLARPTNSRKTPDFKMTLLDPDLIKAARKIYKTYCNLNSHLSKKPYGVAIDRDTHKGQLIFKEKPILLPGECFIQIDRIESEVY
jgi:hypothetical protein